MADLFFPGALDAIRSSLAVWYDDSWMTLSDECVPISSFGADLQAAVTNAGLQVGDFKACRSLDMDADPWGPMWFVDRFPTCVAFSAQEDPDDFSCRPRELVCAGTPTNLSVTGTFGTFEQQVSIVQGALDEQDFVHPLCPGDLPTRAPTPMPTIDPGQALTMGCTDVDALNYNSRIAPEDDDGSCVYERVKTKTDFGIEARWWMNWRLPDSNVEWINAHAGAVTTVHPAHRMINVDGDGSWHLDQWFNYEDDIVPLFSTHVDIMPVVDFGHYIEDAAIYRAFVLGEQAVFDNLLATAYSLAELAVSHNYSGYMLDYEPFFEATLEHAQAFLSYTSIVKHAIDSVDSRIKPSAFGYPYRRVGICLSDWGIIDVTDDDMAAAYAKTNADFVMSMGYTYFLVEEGDAGFEQLKLRAMYMKSIFPTDSITIGVSVQIRHPKTEWWWNADNGAVDRYIEELHAIGIPAISVWGMWDNPPEDPDIMLFADPLDEKYIAVGHHDEALACRALDMDAAMVSVSLAYSDGIQSAYHLDPLLLRVSSDDMWTYQCVRTCVAATPQVSDTSLIVPCDDETRVCAGTDGVSYGTEKEQLLAIAAALTSPDGFHPECPLTNACDHSELSAYWQPITQYERVQEIFPLETDLVTIVGNEWYYDCHRTFVGHGSTHDPCDPSYHYCAGSDGITFGYGENQVRAVAEAAANGGVHPEAPEGCDDNWHMSVL